MSTTSNNGGQTRPLTKHGWNALERLAFKSAPKAEFNPGIVDRLTREPDPLAWLVVAKSPYKSHKGGDTQFLELTDAGRAALAARGGAK